MPINLSKGQKVDLTKGNPGLDSILAGLGWDTNRYDGGHDFDLDVSVFMTNEQGKVDTDTNFVFYNNPRDAAGSVVYSGDNRTGEGEGDDETANITLSKVPANVAKISFTVTIHEAQARGQNFGQVSNAYIRIVDTAKNEELLRYDLGEDYSIETAIVVAELYRHGGEWKFAAIGSGFQGGLEALCRNFGLSV
ncbi:TerD family protein [Anaerotruncus colihominis]|uniref:TerD family protein n=1 Tax=Anaerotruncus colihominis TaxID=169435 RepID=A0A845SUM6_9FIRM|nr:TerD family protein [Anaerotruncus colihominis]MCR2024779.1 TerD family protein [Anaerotruncus colihominis]NBI78384.1 TerD family protein [Anaerotruncus colihominis]NDO38160.1 TerD family protein [Anaerotruncus colihominis]